MSHVSLYHDLFMWRWEAMVYIEDAGADNDGQIGAGIDVMVPTNGLILSWGKEGG